MASTIWNQNLNAGEAWEAEIVLATPAGAARSLRGCEFESQIRRHYKSASAKTTINVSIIAAATGEMKLSLSEAQTTALKNGMFIYDVEMINAPTLEVADASGAFVVDEVITGTTSGATGVVLAHSGTKVTYARSTGVFLLSEVITGSANGVTATTTNDSDVIGKRERIIEGSIEIRPEVTR